MADRSRPRRACCPASAGEELADFVVGLIGGVDVAGRIERDTDRVVSRVAERGDGGSLGSRRQQGGEGDGRDRQGNG